MYCVRELNWIIYWGIYFLACCEVCEQVTLLTISVIPPTKAVIVAHYMYVLPRYRVLLLYNRSSHYVWPLYMYMYIAPVLACSGIIYRLWLCATIFRYSISSVILCYHVLPLYLDCDSVLLCSDIISRLWLCATMFWHYISSLSTCVSCECRLRWT